MSYRTQLRATLFKIWGKKIRHKKFTITDSEHERTLGLLIPLEGNLSMPNWLWYHGWKVVAYKGALLTATQKQMKLEHESPIRTEVEYGIYMLLEVRKLEPGDKQYANHPKYNPNHKRFSELKSKPVLPKQD